MFQTIIKNLKIYQREQFKYLKTKYSFHLVTCIKSLYKRFIVSEEIILQHQNESFPLTSIYFTLIRYLQFINILSFSTGHYNVYVFQYISIIFSLSLLHRAWVNYVIVYYFNTPTVEFLMQGTKTVGYCFVGGLGLHTSLSVYFLPPNAISNAYNINSPTGRGYGAHSCSQLIAVDALKGTLGYDFDQSQILDNRNMVDPNKLKHYWIDTRNKEVGEKFLPKISEVIKKGR